MATLSSDPEVSLELWSAANDTLYDVIGEPLNLKWQERENKVPSGSTTLLMDTTDPVLTEFVEDRKIRVKHDGYLVGTFLVENQRRTHVTVNEESKVQVDISGRGLMAEWERACWLPYGGLGAKPSGDYRVFNWACPEYTYSGWSNCYSYHPRISTQIALDPPWHAPWYPPKGWPTHDADWLWTSNVGSVFTPGFYYFRTTYGLGSDDVVTNFFTGDGRARLRLNGLLAVDWTDEFPTQGFLSTIISTLPQTAGTVHVGLEVEVYDNLIPYGRPPRGIMTWCAHKERMAGLYNSSTLIGSSNPTTWRGLARPSVLPAPSPGKILQTFLQEAQAEGILTGWALSFSSAVDSAGVAWATQPETMFKIGMNGVKTLEQMAGESIDVWVQPALKIVHAWNRGTRPSTSGLTYSTANGNLSNLVMEQGAP